MNSTIFSQRNVALFVFILGVLLLGAILRSQEMFVEGYFSASQQPRRSSSGSSGSSGSNAGTSARGGMTAAANTANAAVRNSA
ncbi:hypothetical protein EB093_08775 [bacterium]|nr:hypothetical protein [bacterium]